MTMNILCIIGTRPEVIKMAPVIGALKAVGISAKVCLTAQHREMVDPLLSYFDIRPDYDLGVMRPNQSLSSLSATLLHKLGPIVREVAPDWVLVQGDTATTLAGALTAYYERTPIGHIEAGLRTSDLYNPFPEEGVRRLVDGLATRCFAPTERAAMNLRAEGIPEVRIVVTGNTGIDALYLIQDRLRNKGNAKHFRDRLLNKYGVPASNKRLLLVTGHRRESFGPDFDGICRGLRRIADTHPEISIVYPVHLNPNVQEPVQRILGGVPNVYLTAPMDYPFLIELMGYAYIVLTDSGGIQEEAPSLGKPLLVMRHITERPEAIEAGVARLIGTDPDTIVTEVERLLVDPEAYAQMACGANPFGDGHAAHRIVATLLKLAPFPGPN